MARGWRKSAGLAAALSALLLALVLRGLVAPGYMPEFDGSGFRIVVCEDQTPPNARAAHAPAHHDQHGGEDPARPDSVCAFAAAGPELAPDAPPPPPRRLLALSPSEPVRRAGRAHIHGPLEGPPPPARAPPRFV